jgi:hypothetical protein
MTNAHAIAYGVELETTIPNRDATPIGRYHHGLPVSWLDAGWKVENDSSIETIAANRKGAEFVSPVMKSLEGLESIRRATVQIKARGGRVNHSCGIHVTVSFPQNDAGALARLIHLVANHEKAIYAATGTTRREASRWAKAIKPYGKEDDAKNAATADRYHLLNLTHLAAGRGRIEFRAFSASLNDDKIAGFVQLCLGLVELALTSSRRQSWNYEQKPGTKGPWARDSRGPGETELHRLFYRLGWTKGHARKRFGVVDTPENLKKTKAVLVKMAQKYDGQTE